MLFQCWKLGPVYFSQCLYTCCFSAGDWDLFILVSVCTRVVSVLETGTCLF